MKRFLYFAIVISLCLSAESKTTYIPTYRSYIHIISGSDTVSMSNNLPDLELTENEGLFTIRLEHENVTQEKVKAIKRAKRAAGWMTFSSVMSGVSTAFSDNSLQYFVRSTTTKITADLAEIYSANANAEEILDIFMWIDNTTDGELMVNDMDRGLVWYILPRQSLRLKIHNPEASRLRISDSKSDVIRYASVTAGSKVTKWDVAWENDEMWIVKVYNEGKVRDNENILYYKRINKSDFEETGMPVKTFNDFIKKNNKSL